MCTPATVWNWTIRHRRSNFASSTDTASRGRVTVPGFVFAWSRSRLQITLRASAATLLRGDYFTRFSPTARSTILSEVSAKLTRKERRTDPFLGFTDVVLLSTQTGPAALRWVASSNRTVAVLGGFWTCASRVWAIKLRGLEFS